MQKYIIMILVTALIGFGIFTGLKIDSLRKQLHEAQNIEAARDTVHILDPDSTLYRKAALEVDRLIAENSGLRHDLKNIRAKLKSQTELVGYYRACLDSIPSTPSETMGDSVRDFAAQKDSLTVKGHFYTVEPYTLSLTDMRLGLGLNVFLAEDNKGKWSTYVETKTPDVVFSQINTKVVPYVRPWYSKIYFLGEVGFMKKTDISVGLGYEKWGHVTYGLDETGVRVVRVGKTWYPWSKK